MLALATLLQLGLSIALPSMLLDNPGKALFTKRFSLGKLDFKVGEMGSRLAKASMPMRILSSVFQLSMIPHLHPCNPGSSFTHRGELRVIS